MNVSYRVWSGTKDLSVRHWFCPACEAHLDRDISAAVNILHEKMRRQATVVEPRIPWIYPWGVSMMKGLQHEDEHDNLARINAGRAKTGLDAAMEELAARSPGHPAAKYFPVIAHMYQTLFELSVSDLLHRIFIYFLNDFIFERKIEQWQTQLT